MGILVVTVEGKRCDWLGHFSYRCGKCGKGYFKAKDDEDYDDRCPNCDGYVHARMTYEER